MKKLIVLVCALGSLTACTAQSDPVGAEAADAAASHLAPADSINDNGGMAGGNLAECEDNGGMAGGNRACEP